MEGSGESHELAESSMTAESENGTDSTKEQPVAGKGEAGCFTIETRLIKFKAFYFFFLGAIGCIYPYVSVYLKQFGFSPSDIGLIAGIRPLIGFCSGLAWGSLADRFRCRRILLCCSSIGWLIFITSLGFVEPAKYSDTGCGFVSDFLTLHNTSNVNVSLENRLSKTADELRFEHSHLLDPDATPEDILLESRGWMFDPSDLKRVFACVIVLVYLGELLHSPTGALSDAECVQVLGADIHKYGRQRAWGSLGMGIFSLVVGGVISTTRMVTTQCGIAFKVSNYTPAFVGFACAMFCCFVTTLFFRFNDQRDERSKPKPNPLKVFRMFLTVHYGSWLWCMFFAGMCNGAIWGFLFWHLENIGANQFLLGVATSVQLISELVTFLFVFWIQEKTGCLVLLALGLVGYIVRFVVYAVIGNPWLVLPVEVLQGATFAGIWSVFIKYLCADLPPAYLGTLQGLLHGVYDGLGIGFGQVITGVAVQFLGARLTFWIFAAASLVNVVVFVIIQKCTTKPDVFSKYEEIKD